MRAWILRKPVFAYYLLTLMFSWGYWFTLIAQGKHSSPGSSESHLPGLLGPMIAAFIMTAYVDGRTGIKHLLGRLLRWRSAWPWGLLLALSPLPVAGLTFLILFLMGTPLPAIQDFKNYPGLPAGMSLTVVVFLVFLLNGCGEEIGWRGFLTERLLQHYSPFQTTLRVAGLWILWHIPVFWINDSMAALVGPMLLGWMLGLVCGAFVLTYLYLFTGRSILMVVVWHTTYNMVVAPSAGAGIPAAIVSTVVMMWGAVIAWKWWRDMRHA